MNIQKLIAGLVEKAQLDGKVFETRKIEFKENYALRGGSGKINKAVQAELIRDVMSLANSLPDPELDTGILILGVATDGQLMSGYTMPVSDISDLQALINGPLERPITFSYREYSISGKKVGVIIIPRSSGIPYIIKNNLSENERIFLRPGECWTRAEGGKKIAMASDLDDLYEYKSGINKFQGDKSKKKLRIHIKRRKTQSQAAKVDQVLNLGTEDLNEKIKRLLK